MKLERELRHKSEDISDDVLSDTVKALGRRVRVSHDYDIPYIAGCSADGRRVFIDRHFLRTFRLAEYLAAVAFNMSDTTPPSLSSNGCADCLQRTGPPNAGPDVHLDPSILATGW
jgi:hypothetical protein